MFNYDLYIRIGVGIVKISDELHEYLRKASNVMSRSVNAQAEFWIKIGIQAELNPDKTFPMIINEMLEKEAIKQQAE